MVNPRTDSRRCVLLVHAHPDDETIGTGAVMAKYAAEGIDVVLVTCTLGEEGEVLSPELAHLAPDESDSLGEHRRLELSAAMSELGIADWRPLGTWGKYRDSGMAGDDANHSEGSFWRADLLEAATDLVQVIRDVRPQVLVTYDDRGGYGHPDHVQAHRVATYAALLSSVATFSPTSGAPWEISKIYWTAFPKSVLRRGIELMRTGGDTSELARLDVDALPFGVADEAVTTAVDAGAYSARKVAALRQYPTQIDMDSGFFSLAEADPDGFGTEYFRLVRGRLGPVDATGRETDLFAGL